MQAFIPVSLIVARLIIGLVIVLLSFIDLDGYRLIAISLLSVGLLTDIFDGIIARQLNTSTRKLRRLDSTVDQLFFILVVVATYHQCPVFFRTHVIQMISLASLEVLTYVVSFVRFKKEVATHSIGAKIWTLFLFATLVELIVHCQSIILFNLCFWLGALTRLEIIAMLLTLKEWTSDVPTFYHSIRLRKGKQITRNKWFNG